MESTGFPLWSICDRPLMQSTDNPVARLAPAEMLFTGIAKGLKTLSSALRAASWTISDVGASPVVSTSKKTVLDGGTLMRCSVREEAAGISVSSSSVSGVYKHHVEYVVPSRTSAVLSPSFLNFFRRERLALDSFLPWYCLLRCCTLSKCSPCDKQCLPGDRPSSSHVFAS